MKSYETRTGCMLNVITYAHAVFLYPRATFVDRVACIAPSWSENGGSYIHVLRNKYIARDWSMLARKKAMQRVEFNSVRRVGDRVFLCFTVTIPSPTFQTSDIWPCLHAYLEVGYTICQGQDISFRIAKLTSFLEGGFCFYAKKKDVMDKHQSKYRLNRFVFLHENA